jgi:predicted acylesterase/phospholipase RssA
MKEYSPKLRTALVLSGSGTSGAYHAGALKALDESGVKIDLIVGSGAGAVAAAYGAVAGGARLYETGGFWHDASWESFYRLKTPLRLGLFLLGASFGVFLLPLALALVGGLLVPLVLIADLAAPGLSARLVGYLAAVPTAMRLPYLAALAMPIFVLSVVAILYVGATYLRGPRRFAESLESVLDVRRARERLARGLWEISRGSSRSARPPSDAELGRRYVALAAENIGQPGFRELILRTADLETGALLPFVILQDAHRDLFAAARTRGTRSRLPGIPGAIDLRAEGYEGLFLDAVLTGVLPPMVAPVQRVAFPKGGLYAGEVHRLTDAAVVAGSGISEALAAGADQVIVVSAAPVVASPTARRRGPRAVADAVLSTLERQAVEADVRSAERINRMVETLGHRTDGGGCAWQDPATGRVYRDFALYLVRPERRPFGPLELEGAQDPATEARATAADLVDLGYRDAYRMFVEPVVGAAPEPRRAQEIAREERAQTIEL